MLNLNGKILEIKSHNGKRGIFHTYRIHDVYDYYVTDFTGMLKPYEVGDNISVNVKAKLNEYNGKAYIQYVC